jgi:hypothetical protein
VDFNGTAYWMAVTAGSANPSPAEVRNASARRRQLLELRSVGSTFVAADVPTAIIVDNLVLGSPYEIYFTVAGSDGYDQVRWLGDTALAVSVKGFSPKSCEAKPT